MSLASKIRDVEVYANRVKDEDAKRALKAVHDALKELDRDLKNLRANVKYAE